MCRTQCNIGTFTANGMNCSFENAMLPGRAAALFIIRRTTGTRARSDSSIFLGRLTVVIGDCRKGSKFRDQTPKSIFINLRIDGKICGPYKE
jgi:hypothetical protein